MIDLDSTSFSPVRPVPGDEGPRQTVRYGGYTIFSVFQPVFSVSHRRAIGYHASLRARDATREHVPSHEVFVQAARQGDLLELGRLAESLHLNNFRALEKKDEWLFLSLTPVALTDTSYGDALVASLKTLGLAPQRVVLEVPEQAGGETKRFTEIVDNLRRAGFLIALDGFGVKHSNIDRVWALQPDIVTLDRCILQQATEHSHIERVLPGLVSLLHESGQLVLMGGLATEREALIALECNVDFVQGNYLAPPSVDAVSPRQTAVTLDKLTSVLRERIATRAADEQARLAPYVAALESGAQRLAAGESVEQASAAMLAVGQTARCFLLDDAGRQIGDNVVAPERKKRRANRFAPLQHSEGASWERRPYFTSAVHAPGRVQFTPPYLSINDAQLCVTASIAARVNERLMVLCADIDWDGAAGG
jgi:EAL domain-containing protein (putative c-di-GMP-specific phosphodiesterase class I)